MVINRRGQFFILAAVIISAVIISLGVVSNVAVVNEDPNNFADFTYEVKRETGAVIDYEIYTDVQGGNLSDFVGRLAKDIMDRDIDSGSNFMFIYGGTEDGITIENYVAGGAFVEGEEVDAANSIVLSKICSTGVCLPTTQTSGDSDADVGIMTLTPEQLENKDGIKVEIDGNEYSFPISKYRQVIFVIQKEDEGGKYVSVK